MVQIPLSPFELYASSRIRFINTVPKSRRGPIAVEFSEVRSVERHVVQTDGVVDKTLGRVDDWRICAYRAHLISHRLGRSCDPWSMSPATGEERGSTRTDALEKTSPGRKPGFSFQSQVLSRRCDLGQYAALRSQQVGGFFQTLASAHAFNGLPSSAAVSSSNVAPRRPYSAHPVWLSCPCFQFRGKGSAT